MHNYQFVSPSLEGILSHSSIVYEGITRPLEVLRVMDGPATRGNKKSNNKSETTVQYTKHEQRVIEQYFHDVYSVFMKKLSGFIVSPEMQSVEAVQLQAMLQEIIKVKHILNTGMNTSFSSKNRN